MNTYIDKDYLIAENTLISYTGSSGTVNVPGKFDQIDLLQIGKGAFCGLNYLEDVTLPYGLLRIQDMAFESTPHLRNIAIPGSIQYIGKDAFQLCPQLEKVIWYDIELDDYAYQNLKENCSKTTDNIYLAAHIPRFITDIGFTVNQITGAAVLMPKNASALFKLEHYDDNAGSAKLFKDIKHFCFVENCSHANEHKAFIHQIHTNNFATVPYTAELANDMAVKTEKPLSKEKTFIFTFDDKKTSRKNGKIYITATIEWGYYFWQSGQRVICDKKDYYIYSRFFLTPKEEVQYIREDMAIYKDDRIVSDKKEAQRVYGKYKLLSIL